MTPDQSAQVLPTVSRAFLDDWLIALRTYCPPEQVQGFFDQIGLSITPQPRARVTHDQIVQLYQLIAKQTGDEMMGLWSRPVRSGALKHLCRSVRGASSLSASLFRFASFWNLLLDDFTLVFEQDENALRIKLLPRGTPIAQRFGHMLLLKLVHGIASWLTGRELPLHRVSFCFERPEFAEDYSVLFPSPVLFGQPHSSIEFEANLGDLEVHRSDAEMQVFLQHAPRDWIFTNYREHVLPLRVRELILLADCMDYHLSDAAKSLSMTPRTLIRRLNAEGTSFQTIKDGLRRDIAIRDLSLGTKSIEAISQDIGFASAANFYRAFHRWTGVTPGAYKKWHRIQS